jgi:hypothetical protein
MGDSPLALVCPGMMHQGWMEKMLGNMGHKREVLIKFTLWIKSATVIE